VLQCHVSYDDDNSRATTLSSSFDVPSAIVQKSLLVAIASALSGPNIRATSTHGEAMYCFILLLGALGCCVHLVKQKQLWWCCQPVWFSGGVSHHSLASQH
jgi:hypothetical protein